MEIQQVRPAGLRAASVSLIVSIVCLWILIPAIAVLSGVLFLASILFNDSGHVPQATAPFIGETLFSVVGLAFLLRYSMRTRRDLAQMVPRARTAMIVFGAIYTVLALGVLFFPFPNLLAVLPGALGIWWLIYFLRTTAFESPQPVSESLPPAS